MRVVARRTLVDFYGAHGDAKVALETWYRLAKKAAWKSPKDVRESDPRASVIANDRIVFDIRGGHYRLVAAIHYRTGIVFIRFIGTHADYDEMDATTI